MPAFGLGTWRMGEDASKRADEVAALREGFELGVRLVDTAEMYADAELVVGEALRGYDDVYVVSKVLPENASRSGTLAACERSLRRLGVERIDCYLLHWRASYPLAETVAAFEELVENDKIGCWGVSNFDIADLDELEAVEPSGEHCATNQILYNLTRRGPEAALLERCTAASMQVMAYSPLEQARLDWVRLEGLAAELGATPAQIAIAWTMREPWLVSIPKASSLEHVRANVAACELQLDAAALAEIDRLFPREHDQLEVL